MHYRLTAQIKRRLIQELREYWGHHPRYRDLVENIQGKFSFRERPQQGMVVKTGSGSRMDLSADNFVGVVHSYVYLTRVRDYPGAALEWVREDALAIQRNQGVFPSPPGVYYLELTEEDEFYVDPLLDIYRESVLLESPTKAQLAYPPLGGTLRLYEMPAGYTLPEGEGYTLTVDETGKPTGEILLATPLTGGRALVADYKTPGESHGPYKITPETANNTVIPGVVLAFGKRNEKGDRLAVVVDHIRRPAALEYGGRWDMSVDIDILARDVHAQQDISDQTAIFLWGILRPRISFEGLEITDVSMGGEGEEPIDENGDDYWYTGAISMTVQTEWAIHVPLTTFLRQVTPLSYAQSQQAALLSDEQLAGWYGNIQMLSALNLEMYEDPFYVRAGRFEGLK